MKSLEQKAKHDCKGRKDGQFLAPLPDSVPLGMVRHPGQLQLLSPWREWSQSGVEDGAVYCLRIVTAPVVSAETPADREGMCWRENE